MTNLENTRQALIDERKALQSFITASGQVFNGDMESLMMATGLAGASEAYSAFMQDTIGQEWFDFVEAANNRKSEVLSNIQALPRKKLVR